jgi:hypothetical protein
MSILFKKNVGLLIVFIAMNSLKAQTIPSGSLRAGLGFSFYAEKFKNKDIDLNLQIRPVLGYFFFNDLGINCQLNLGYSKISTGYQVHIESNENITPYIQWYALHNLFITGGSQIELNYQYVPNIATAIGYSLFATKSFTIEPEINATFSFGKNAVRPVILQFAIGLRYYYRK